MERQQVIVKTSLIGIITNIFLAAFKAVLGFLSNSIAIVLDAINNLSDVLSSVITIVGAKLAEKEPDREHPFGHGRVEYLSAMIIAVIILYAGITSFAESVKKLINPEIPEYSNITLIFVAVAIVVKILLGRYSKKIGEEVNSESLINSGKDAINDAIISSSTLVAAIIFILFDVSLEAYLGIAISIIIIKAGIEMIRSTYSQILGERVEKDISLGIKKTVASFPEVKGAFDLVLSDYGPDTYLGSIHIEVMDTMTAAEIDKLTRIITSKVYKEHNVLLSAIGIYSINTKDKEAMKVKEKIRNIIKDNKDIIQLHGFYYNKEDKAISFDIIIDFACKDKIAVYQEVFDKVQELYPDYKIRITLDADVSD